MRHLTLGLTLFIGLALVACGGGASTLPTAGDASVPSESPANDAPTGGDTASTGGMLRVRITDAPFPFTYVERAEVTIREVRVRRKNGEDGGWMVVFEGEETIDLVPLQNGVSHLLVDAEIEEGTYDEVRLIVDAGEVELTDDAWTKDGDQVFSTLKGNLHFPSGAQTGIKVKIDNDIVVTTELSADLVLDFALTKNFVFNGPMDHAPGVKRVIFTPVIRATNASEAGSLQLTVRSDSLTPNDTADDVSLENATVSVFAEDADLETDDPLTTGDTDEQGLTVFSLAPGMYLVVAEAEGHAPSDPLKGTVTLANREDLGDVILAATGEIRGVVMSNGGTDDDDSDDVVIAEVKVTTTPQSGTDEPDPVETNASGAFQITGLAPGLYDLVFEKAGFEDGALDDVASALVSSGQTIVLKALFTDLSGTVSDADDAAVSGATVTVVNADGTEVDSTTTGTDGTYSLTLATGVYEITFETSDASTSTTEDVTIDGEDPTDTQTLDVTL